MQSDNDLGTGLALDIALVIQNRNAVGHIRKVGVSSSIRLRCHEFSGLKDITEKIKLDLDLSCILYQINFDHEPDLEAFTDFRDKMPELPVILIGDLEDDVLALNLRQNGAEDYWSFVRLKHLDVVTRICLAIERSEIIAMLEDERSSMEELMEAFNHGQIKTIPDAQFPSGAIKILDARLAEQNEALLSKIEQKNKELDRIAHIDALTDLPNRRQFERSFKAELARAKRHGSMFALLYIDLDNFKTVNDTLGHHVGDLLLSEVAERLQSNVRESDLSARMAGDEFAVLVSDIDGPHDAGIIAQKIVNAVAERYDLDGKPVSCGCSIGIACFPHAGENMETLSQSADMAMYAAKKNGRNIYKYYTDELNEKHRRRLTIEQGLRFAQENNELQLVFQPQYELNSQKFYGYEVLLRWIHPELGNIEPTEFIPIAEKSGMMIGIGDWVIETAIAQFASWKKEYGIDCAMGLNISPVQIKPSLPIRFKECFDKYDEDLSHHVEIEITESVIMADNKMVEQVLVELNNMGIQIGIDDFGTGYSSLSYLQKLPVSTLKIDRSFVEAMSTSTNDKLLVKSVINLARDLNLTIIAEGIETHDQLDYLNGYGCRIGQGFYFAKPQKAADMSKIFKKRA